MQGKERLCHIQKWDHFDGYGFDLHAEKGKPGQYIGKVDDGSPSQAAGLRQGDRILEVNGANIVGKTHREVVDLIKTVPNETKLLVVSDDISTSATDGNSDSKNLQHQQQQQPPQIIENHNNNKSNGISHSATNGSAEKSETISNHEHDHDHDHEHPQPRENGNGTHAHAQGGGLNLNMTAAELRARLAAKKKFDPKKETTLDFKKKFDIIQKM